MTRSFHGRLRYVAITTTVVFTFLFSINATSSAQDTNIQTLILANKNALITLYGAEETTALLTDLNQLAAHATVKGMIVFVDETPAVANAYSAWQTNLTSPSHANVVADAIRSLIHTHALTLLDLKYIVLVGDDRIIPHRRVADETPNYSEQHYAEVPIDTTIGAALTANLFLSDDFYGEEESLTTVQQASVLPPAIYRPTRAVGRLVETPTEMQVAIHKFLATNGEIQVSRSLVAGYDYMQDAAQETCAIFTGALPQASHCTFIGEAWSEAQLDTQIQSDSPELLFLHNQSNHWSMRTPNEQILLPTALANWPIPTTGRLVYSLGAHDGLSVPPTTPNAFDWPQAWLAQGALYIANTGYSWGLYYDVGLSEKLGVFFAENLAALPTGTAGEALIAAKQRYIDETASPSAYDKKVVNELTLYGLPMMKVTGFDILPDPYEPNNRCKEAKTILTDGVAQSHSLHNVNDIDWVAFDAIAEETYIIEVQPLPNTTIDLYAELHNSCADATLAVRNKSAGQGAGGIIMPFKATVSGRYLLKISNLGSTNTGGKANYTLVVREQADSSKIGALIVVAGRLKANDPLQSNIHHATNALYNRFRNHGYSDENIYYLATDATLPGYDAAATIENLRLAITTWAKDKVSNEQYLTIYLSAYGDRNLFYLDKENTQQITSDELTSWLAALEAVVPNIKINMIIEQCYAGSFIAKPSSISKPGRLVIASTDASGLAFASKDGIGFSDAWIDALVGGRTLDATFQMARTVLQEQWGFQQPQLDGDGDGIANEVEDFAEAERRVLFADDGNIVPTATATATPPIATSTATAFPAPSPTPLITPIPEQYADEYEVDDICVRSGPIAPDGSRQRHNFHSVDDRDWIQISTTANTVYQVDITVPDGSPANIELLHYNECAGIGEPHSALGPGVQFRFRATSDRMDYLQINNLSGTFGPQVTYEVTVRDLPATPQSGALIIVAGRNRLNDYLQPNIHQATDDFYRLFRSQGHTADQIYYLAHDLTLDPDNNAQTQDVDGLPTRAKIEYAITEWAAQPRFALGAESVLTIYLTDHGDYNTFLLNGKTESLTPNDLDQWLRILENKIPGLAINVIVDACLSGSFIEQEQSLSGPNRVVIASTASQANAYAARGHGIIFTNALIQALSRQLSLYDAFQEAQRSTVRVHPDQTAWLDDNGNGIPNEAGDGLLAQQRGFAFFGTLSDWGQEAPYITHVDLPQAVSKGSGMIRAQFSSQSPIQEVWAMIVAPSYVPPTPNGELLPAIDQPTILLTGPDNDGSYTGIYEGFDQLGRYRIVVNAVDKDGRQSLPATAEFYYGSRLWLPIIMR